MFCVPLCAQAQEAAALRAALLLFLTAHAVVWVQPPGTPPDARTLATLRLLQQAKQLLQPSLPQLVGAGGSADPSPPWQQPPLLLFACQVGLTWVGRLTRACNEGSCWQAKAGPCWAG